MPPSPPRPRSPKSSSGGGSGNKIPPRSPSRSPNPHGAGSSATAGGTSTSASTTLRLNLASNNNKPKGDASPKRSTSPKPATMLSAGTSNLSTTPKSNNNSPAAAAASTSSPNKKRKYTPPSNLPPHLAMASFVRVLHQTSNMNFVLAPTGNWISRGTTILYATDTAPGLPTTTQLAFHLRSTCCVEHVQVETIGVIPNNLSETDVSTTTMKASSDLRLETWKTQFDHIDPLEHVLIKPASSYTETDFIDEEISNNSNDKTNHPYQEQHHYDADAQCSRGAAGMTTGLRAASIASNMGELRLTIDRPSNAAGRPPLDAHRSLSEEERQRRRIWLEQQWKHDLETTATTLSSNNNTASSLSSLVGRVGCELHRQLQRRTANRRAARLGLIAQKMAESSDTEQGRRAFKITVQYRLDPNDTASPTIPFHAGGIHVIPGKQALTTMSSVAVQQPQHNSLPPHIYTTAGTYGDHEGTRCWLPCLDSASYKHRASHQLTLQVTAPMREGMQIVGCGEDFGVHETWLHYKQQNENDDNAIRQRSLTKEYLGAQHVEWIEHQFLQQNEQHANNINNPTSTPHVIPPDTDASMDEASSIDDEEKMNQDRTVTVASIDNILATQVWATTSWLPVPARSLGFAVGPFNVVEDPEYFEIPEIDLDDDENLALKEDVGDANLQRRRQMELERERERIEDARVRGEGIRQVYFAPIYERKHIHVNAKTLLLEEAPKPSQSTDDNEDSENDDLAGFSSPSVEFQLLPVTSRQKRLSKGLEKSVLFATSGVAHRALSLTRDILALPSYRTAAYTQIWIPSAENGGYSCGSLQSCPEVRGANTFLGGAIIDAGLLPPVGKRISFYQGGGRVLQLLQARCAIRGWIIASLPLGGQDDLGNGYIHSLIENFLMSLYEKAHGAYGEGGAKGSLFYTKRFSAGSGLNSSNLDFLPVRNVEEIVDVAVGGVMAAVPVEDRNNDQLWRSASNGTESHTSSMDEFAVRQVLCKDAVDALERGTDKDKYVPLPSMGWLGSHLSLSFLSSNATSSSDLGGGALELVHATGGLVYRSLKTEVLARIVEGRAGVANFIRLVRASFVASHLDDMGEKELKMPSTKKDKRSDRKSDANTVAAKPIEPELIKQKPRFVICVNEVLKKKGLTHTLFTRALQNLAGRIREALLLGRLVDVDRETIDPRTKHPLVDPEGFPNAFVRGACSLYLRVGVHVEVSRDSNPSSAAANPGGIQMQAYAEPIIPEGGIAFSGPITIRIVENEGQFREFVKDLTPDGSRRDWGTTHLHAQPVTTPKAQTAASGVIETTAKDRAAGGGSSKGIFSSSIIHGGGYQAIELIRLTNLTPLLWVRVDPMGLYGGRISVFQQDACLAEQLFHDGDAGAQVEAMRHLAERPLRIQGSVKVTSVYDVKIHELPVRVLGDCLRGSPALHSSLPHTPAVRAQAALAIAQWQNNKAPPTSNAVGDQNWIGLNLLIQYFKERYYSNGVVMPVKFTRIVLKKNEVEVAHEAAAGEGGGPNPNPKEDLSYQYLDAFEEGAERAAVLEEAEEIGVEEDEEYRVRAAVVTAIASIRAKDGMTPPLVVKFMETILEGEDTEMAGNVVYPDEDIMSEKKSRKAKASSKGGYDEAMLSPYPYVSSMLVADSLLALCHINAAPALITDPATGKAFQSTAIHPVSKLMEISLRWLQWELYRESIRAEAEADTMTGIGQRCHDSVAACAITALSSLAILRQSTTDPPLNRSQPSAGEKKKEGSEDEEDEATSRERKRREKLDEVTTAKFYLEIFHRDPPVSDLTRAACAQAVACIFCASDRFERKDGTPSGLLASLEFLLDSINDPRSSVALKNCLAELMMDASTGKICSMQRVAAIGGKNELVTSAARFYNGPLGASNGGDSGSACLMSVSPSTYPAANAVNDGARRGLRMMSRAGHPRETFGEKVIVRIARFATNLWRTINGEAIAPQGEGAISFSPLTSNGVCAYDGHLRCALLSLWQWLYANRCLAVLQVQSWKSHEKTKNYEDLGANHVMKITEEEKAAASAEEASLEGLNRLVNVELDRQKWRGEMAMKAYEYLKNSNGNKVDVSAAEQGIGQPLPPIQRDTAFKSGGWVASAAQQRRALALDGGTAVTKLRLTVKS